MGGSSCYTAQKESLFEVSNRGHYSLEESRTGMEIGTCSPEGIGTCSLEGTGTPKTLEPEEILGLVAWIFTLHPRPGLCLDKQAACPARVGPACYSVSDACPARVGPACWAIARKAN